MVRADQAMYAQKGRRSKYLLDSMTTLQAR